MASHTLVLHLYHAAAPNMGGTTPHQLHTKKTCLEKTKTEKKQIYKYNSPVMRLLGSKTSIFSSKSTAPADMFGNLAAKFCLGYCGSCLTYLLALSLLKNPKLESSGDPISCFSKIHQQMQMIPKRNTKQRFYG